MALRDHSLDERIIEAARAEFLDKGYSGASLRKIAERAGVTVGAIQVRYASKDALFASLLQPFLEAVEATFRAVKADYYGEAEGGLLAHLRQSMRQESEAILHLLFDHYGEALLLLHRSGGSSLEGYFDGIVARKIGESAAFFQAAGYDADGKLLGMLISLQFDGYRRILRDCPDRESARHYMNALMTYHFGGWAALFQENAQEGAHEV